VAPTRIEGLLGLTVIELRPTTVKVVEPLKIPELAWIVVVPAASPVASPEELIEATLPFEEVQLTERVKS